jgi:hypothetical protein
MTPAKEREVALARRYPELSARELSALMLENCHTECGATEYYPGSGTYRANAAELNRQFATLAVTVRAAEAAEQAR